MQDPRPQELSDEELDAYVLTRLRAVGVDLSVLPLDDPDAAVDQRRVLAGARQFLRTTPSAILSFDFGGDSAVPSLYPAATASRPAEEGGDG